MGRDIFGLLIEKFSLDARREARELERQRQLHLQRQRSRQRLYQVARYCLLVIVGAAVIAGLRFASELGGMAGEMAARRAGPDPSLIAPPKSTAKHMRKLAESRRQRDDDLEEIMK